MKKLFDNTCAEISKLVTLRYSTSFSLGIRLLSPNIRPEIYAIYGFVRYADEIVDTFLDYDREKLLTKFIADYHMALDEKISLNPILNTFQKVVHDYDLQDLVAVFLKSMQMDLDEIDYQTEDEYKAYIRGSAEAVGLMCLKVFVGGDKVKYTALKDTSIALGAAFQKVNFLRDYKNDVVNLGRSYFPNITAENFDDTTKKEIVADIEKDFQTALVGIRKLPNSSRFGVLLAYKYYTNLLKKLHRKTPSHIKVKRTRIPDFFKAYIFLKAYVRYKINWI